MTVTTTKNGILSMTITGPVDIVEEASMRMVQDAVDLGRARLKRTEDGLVIVVEEGKAGL